MPSLAAKLSDAVLPAQPVQHDPDLVFRRMVLTRCAADVFDNLLRRRSLWSGFLSHLRSPLDYDEPEILQSSSHAFCSIGAEPGHTATCQEGYAGTTCPGTMEADPDARWTLNPQKLDAYVSGTKDSWKYDPTLLERQTANAG